MKVYVSIDMEGVAGVATVRHVMRGSDDYPYFRKLMTAEANAAALGAFDAGATQVVVNDSHGDMHNLVPDMMDDRVKLLTGSPKPGGMTAALDETYDLCMFAGYHAPAGTTAAVLDHTIATVTVHSIVVNGEQWAESDINAAHAGGVGVPLGLVTGDDKICAHVRQRQPWAKTVEVKQALSRGSAIALHPSKSCALIREGAAAAVRDAASMKLYQPAGPFDLELTYTISAAADAAGTMPGAERIGGRTLGFKAADVETLLRGMRTLISLGGGASFKIS